MRGIGYQVAVCLLIDEISPTPYGLREQQTRRYIVGDFHRVLFFDFRHNIHGNITENHAAVNPQASVAESEKIAPFLLVTVIRKGEKINPRAENGKRQNEQRVVQTVIRVLAVLFEQLRKNHYGKNHARDDNQRIISYSQSPDFYGGAGAYSPVEVEKRLVEVENFEQQILQASAPQTDNFFNYSPSKKNSQPKPLI